LELDKKLVAVVVVAVVAIVVVVSVGLVLQGSETPETFEEIGGKYDAIVSYYGDNRTLIEYRDETGNHIGDYYPSMAASLDWVKANTPEDSVFLCWWDYGHMIEAYAERDAVVKDPSEEILDSVVVTGDITEFASHQTILGVADAFCG
jgi:asparagine N-glycosylation enzyme membrane subunit Stt3